MLISEPILNLACYLRSCMTKLCCACRHGDDKDKEEEDTKKDNKKAEMDTRGRKRNKILFQAVF